MCNYIKFTIVTSYHFLPITFSFPKRNIKWNCFYMALIDANYFNPISTLTSADKQKKNQCQLTLIDIIRPPDLVCTSLFHCRVADPNFCVVYSRKVLLQLLNSCLIERSSRDLPFGDKPPDISIWFLFERFCCVFGFGFSSI